MKIESADKARKLVLHNLFLEEEDGGYCALCLDRRGASQGDSLDEAKMNIKEAVALYLESVYEHGDMEDAIPRPAPLEYWLKYFSSKEKNLREDLRQITEENLDFEQAVA